MKGIILAGGSGTRLYPITIPTVKQLLPIYDKPMIYYPLSVLIQAGVKEVLIISTPQDIHRFEELFGDGSELGIEITYQVQNEPKGLAEALIIGEEFIGNDNVWLILGDNLLYGANLTSLLNQVSENKKGATIFGYHVSDPKRYGVIEFDKNNKVISIEEKPQKPKSNFAAIGLYYYDSKCVEMAKKIKPSNRGEIEITSLNNEYLKKGELNVRVMNRGMSWFDTGTYDSLIDASNYVRVLEKAQGLKIGCIEEITFKRKNISREQLIKLGNKYKKTSYGQYLLKIADEKEDLLPDTAQFKF
ncbi:MAG: glucose-1-phosphate thymidylyltransferase RfbA [Nanoarchaeota archaeon]|nr:glucose-1-phosphate thymidylyltransferase RfbA [Nanoarchaeota archaeon]